MFIWICCFLQFPEHSNSVLLQPVSQQTSPAIPSDQRLPPLPGNHPGTWDFIICITNTEKLWGYRSLTEIYGNCKQIRRGKIKQFIGIFKLHEVNSGQIPLWLTLGDCKNACVVLSIVFSTLRVNEPWVEVWDLFVIYRFVALGSSIGIPVYLFLVVSVC